MAIGIPISTEGRLACLRFQGGMLVPLQDAAGCGCCLKVLLSEWRVRFGARMLVLLAAGCCCLEVLLSVVCAVWCGHAGAAARCCLRVLLSDWCVRFGAGMLVPLQGAA